MNQTAIQKIRDLQNQEGNKSCFKTDKLYCQFTETCCWADLCLDIFRVRPMAIFDVKEG